MSLPKVIGVFIATFFVAIASATPLQLSDSTGTVNIRKNGQAEWQTITDNVILSNGDSISIGSGNAIITAGDSLSFLLKDSCILAIVNTVNSTTISLEKGQLFLNRTSSDKKELITIMAKKCSFSPIGTAGAVKINKHGAPSVAVLKGSILATSPTGTSMNVKAGMFSSFDPNTGTFLPQKQLPQSALNSLEAWSGVKADIPEVMPTEDPVVSQDTLTQEIKDTTSESSDTASKPDTNAVKNTETPQTISDTAKTTDTTIAIDKKETPPLKKEISTAPKAEPVAKNQKPAKEEPKSDSDSKSESKENGKPKFSLSADNTTVDGEQWTRIAFSVDVPIWKFGVCFDAELWLDSKGQFSDKGWRFTKDDWAESIARKIRYVRFNHETDPVFIKFMGIDNVTFGYGFVVDRFTNMLNYPNEKLLGLQFYLNDISPIGITLQTMVGDFLDFRYDGGVGAVRLAVTPLKPTEIPIVSKLTIGALYATDRDQFAEGRKWKSILKDGLDSDGDGKPDRDELKAIGAPDSTLDQGVEQGWVDTQYVNPEIEYANNHSNAYSILGFDIGLPLIQNKFLGLDIYGQFGMSIDDTTNDIYDTVDASGGWGIGAPGVRLRVGPVVAQVEYRHIDGYFEPGYFGPYYYQNRLTRYPNPIAKENTLDSVTLDGVFGTLGGNIANVLILSGKYQYLIGDNKTDQRFEATAGIGQMLLQKIPKISKVEAFYYQTDIVGNIFKDDVNKYWGYRLATEITGGAGVIWETRYGWKYDQNGKLVQDNNITIGASLSF